jgi:hypothetical protein
MFVGAGVMLSPSAGAATAGAVVAVHLGPTPIADDGQTAKPPKMPFFVVVLKDVLVTTVQPSN